MDFFLDFQLDYFSREKIEIFDFSFARMEYSLIECWRTTNIISMHFYRAAKLHAKFKMVTENIIKQGKNTKLQCVFKTGYLRKTSDRKTFKIPKNPKILENSKKRNLNFFLCCRQNV